MYVHVCVCEMCRVEERQMVVGCGWRCEVFSYQCRSSRDGSVRLALY